MVYQNTTDWCFMEDQYRNRQCDDVAAEEQKLCRWCITRDSARVVETGTVACRYKYCTCDYVRYGMFALFLGLVSFISTLVFWCGWRCAPETNTNCIVVTGPFLGIQHVTDCASIMSCGCCEQGDNVLWRQRRER